MSEKVGEIVRIVVLLLFVATAAGFAVKARDFGCVSVPDGFASMQPAIEAGKRITYRKLPPTAKVLPDDTARRMKAIAQALPVDTIIVYRAPGNTKGEFQVARVVAHAGKSIIIQDGKYYHNGIKINTKADARQFTPVRNLMVPRDCVLIGFDSSRNVPLMDCIIPLTSIMGTVEEKQAKP